MATEVTHKRLHSLKSRRRPRQDATGSLPGLARWLGWTIEIGLLLLVAATPWCFGGAEPIAELAVYATVAVLAVTWAVRMGVQGLPITWQCPVTLCLVGLLLLGWFQSVELPTEVVRWLSPGTIALRSELQAVPELPAQAISIYPGGSSRELVRWLAFACLFLIARNNFTGPSSWQRLAAVAFGTGTLLSLFGIVQYLGVGGTYVYWVLPAPNHAFGPFVCRNHFPFFVNACLGLSLCLLATMRDKDRQENWEERTPQPLWLAPLSLLHRPRMLWIIMGLLVMVLGVLLSQSRGGVVALAIGAFVALGLWVLRHRQRHHRRTLILAALACAGLLAGSGWLQLQSRYASLTSAAALEESRGTLWRQATELGLQFPQLGTGLGTFPHVFPLVNQDPGDVARITDHVHNEYLEALVEGGVPRLLLTLLVVGFLGRACWRGLRRSRSQLEAAIAIAAAFALTTMAVHSALDFGIHLAANAVLAAIVAGFAANWLPNSATPTGSSAQGAAVDARRFAVLRRVPGMLLVLGMGLLPLLGGWRAYHVQRLRLAAIDLAVREQPATQRIPLLAMALPLAPDHARLHFELAEAYEEAEQEKLDALSLRFRLREAALLVAAGLSGPDDVNCGMLATTSALRRQYGLECEVARECYDAPALEHLRQAAALCPTLTMAHLHLAAREQQAAVVLDHSRRAQRSAPASAQVWYVSGMLAQLTGEANEGRRCWRTCLGLSDEFYTSIMQQARPQNLSVDEVVAMLPESPELFFRTARSYYGGPEQEEARLRLYRSARRLLDENATSANPTKLRLQALVLAELGEPLEAVQALEVALALDPTQQDWRWELAEVLARQQQPVEARQQLLRLLRLHPEHQQALALLHRLPA